jgi:predicted alpha/beta-hydrolase family hydrolase
VTVDLTFRVPEAAGEVSALLSRSADARVLYVLGHGAGAGMRHPFLERISGLLVDRGVATFRYQFPYMECGKRRPDSHRVLHGTVRAAVAAASDAMPDVPLLAGGKSMGGRMTSLVQAAAPLPGVVGLVFLGFPLHAPKKPTTERAEHLADVTVPMLFLQGTRDSLADLTLLGPVIDVLGDRATMHIVEGGDHSFKVLKRSGRTADEVFEELAHTIATWGAELA